MLPRRTFLTGALGATLLAPSLVRALGAPIPAVHVVVDGGCADAQSFALACGLNDSAHRDAAALATTLEAMREPACAGLGRDSQLFLLTRLLAPRGYRLVYEGRHDYVAGRVHHQLRGMPGDMQSLAAALGHAGSAWPRCLAAAAPRLARSVALKQTTAYGSASLPAPTDGPGLLVSWCLLRS